MTALERLIKAEGLQGGTIHEYNRRFGEDVTEYGSKDFGALALRMIEAEKFDLAKLASLASIAHLNVERFKS